MKKLTWLFITVLTLIFLSACGQHTSFQGKWKAQKANGEDIDIVFNDKTGKLGDKEFHYKIDKSSYQDNTTVSLSVIPITTPSFSQMMI